MMAATKSELMVSVSGVRGVVGDSFTPEVVLKYVRAFGSRTAAGAEFVVGRDSRTSGPWIVDLVAGTLRALGHQVTAVGLCGTPTLGYAVRKRRAAGGIMVTASHNPVQWNALKFLGPDGGFVRPDVARRVFAAAHRGAGAYADYRRPGVARNAPELALEHLRAVLRLVPPRRTGRQLKVVLDTVNGAGVVLVPEFLRRHGCRVHLVNSEPHGLFAHAPEPVPKNLKQLGRAVIRHRADLGIAVDPDVDRVAFVDERGHPIGEELSLAFATLYVLSRQPGPVVVNLSTSRVCEELAWQHRQPFYRTPVGEAHVARKMRQVNAVIGGEGNGGVIYPRLHPGRDALAGIAFLLALLRGKRRPLSELVSELPVWHLVREAVPKPRNWDRRLKRVTDQARGGRVDTRDGVRIDWPEGWIQIRPSNTEPIVRILAEARTAPAARRLLQAARERLTD